MDDVINIFNINEDKLEKECDDGNIEYKRELINLDELTINKRMTQMKYRLFEGKVKAVGKIIEL